MPVFKEKWGNYNGYEITLFTLVNEKGMKVKLTNYGATIVGIELPDRNGNNVDVVLGYDDFQGYLEGSSFQGATAGRYANRIGGARFNLNDVVYTLECNDGENMLHGGFIGYDKRVWMCNSSSRQNSVIFTYFSHDGECGFPGNVKISIKFTLTSNNELKIQYFAKSDADTIVNLTNHSYFNLNGSGSVLDTILQINAVNYTPVDEMLIPTGEIEPVFGTVYNFTKPKRIGADIETNKTSGYDHNYLLGEAGMMKKAAVAYSKENGIIMAAYTDMPAMQLYTANGLNEIGKNKQLMTRHGGFCLETQYSPNTPNMSGFPTCVLKRGKAYRSATIYAFGIKY